MSEKTSDRYDKEDREEIIKMSDAIIKDLYRWGRMDCACSISSQSIYLTPHFGVTTFYQLIKPDDYMIQLRYYYNIHKKGFFYDLIRVDAKYSPYLFRLKFVKKLISKYQQFVYGLVYQKYINRYPRFKHIILLGASHPPLIKGGVDYITSYNDNYAKLK